MATEERDSGLQFRPMQVGDLPAVLVIERACYPHPWSERLFLDELSESVADIVVALLEGEVTGYLCTRRIADEMEVLNLAVAPTRQGRGIGRRLLHHVLSGVTGVTQVFLEVRVGNRPARALYRASGFVETGLRTGYYQDGEDAVLMTLDLSQESA